MSSEDENASELQFGDEFSSVTTCLTNDEMYFLLARRLEAKVALNDSFKQTFEYVEKVATTKIQSDVESLTMELNEKLRNLELERSVDRKRVPLHPFEISSIANLAVDGTTPEELISLVHSLSRFSDDQLEIAIQIVAEAKERAGSGM